MPCAYRGRFAPSPSGPLHFGSLVCALASWLDARAHQGQWLLRIEDIDPPREQAGADLLIIDSLKQHGLDWDESHSYQSQHQHRYQQQLQNLKEQGLSYRCNCNRKRLKELTGCYDGHCRLRTLPVNTPAATRLNCDLAFSRQSLFSFQDRAQGLQKEDLAQSGDFIIHRKDGLFAYQLAVSCDDSHQGITHVVRGSDLLETTCKQVALMTLFGASTPNYLHIPVISSSAGQKLSKQNHAPALNNTEALENVKRACRALGMDTHSAPRELRALLTWATERWPQLNLDDCRELLLSDLS
ncbi:tRNA glutamyl-Q(34) synthetase GluQRS [Agaribacterium sp. ZY112]|uniref:tRNA glutamyl-Q(34) synthetase GluQRS n=1 Tax=Agaribacterium sp. ZY112 TaxID=3233574 RepID=UPI003525047C